MSKMTVRCAVATLVILGAAVAFTHAGSHPMRPQYAVELQVTPSEGQERAYESVVIVRDITTRAIVAQTKLRSDEGKLASIESSDAEGGMDLKVNIEIGAAGKTTSYTVELRDRAGVLARFEAQVRLENL